MVPNAIVVELISAYNRGAAASLPDSSSLVVQAMPDVGMLDTRAVLARYRLARPSIYEGFRADPHLAARTVTGASAADVAFVARETETAYRAYLDQVHTNPDAIHGLVGLGLTRPDRTTDPAARALLGRTELVRAIGTRLAASRPVDVIDLATWIGASLPPVGPDPVGWQAI